MEGSQKKVLELLRWTTYKLGFKEQHKQFHLKLFPGYQATLENAKKNSTISLPEGGIQLLKPVYDPAEKKMVYPNGIVFWDGVPINQPVEELDHLKGMNIWLDSNKLYPDGSGNQKDYNYITDESTMHYYAGELVKRLEPEEALRLMDSEKNYWTYRDSKKVPYSMSRMVYFEELCKKAAEKPGLLKINPKWFIGEDKNEDYQLKGSSGLLDAWASVQAHSADNNYLESIGYIPMSQAFQAFKLPRTVHMIDKLVEEGKIPAKREERKVNIPA